MVHDGPRPKPAKGTVEGARMRTLGSTGLPVTPVGVGLAAVGRPAYITLGRGEDLGPDRGVDDLRLYQIHSATLESGVLEDRAVLGELAGLRNQGLAVGLTTSGPRQSETVLRAVAIAAVLANPWVDVVLSGAVNPGQLAGNLAGERLRLGADDLAELAALAEPPERYWAERGELPWV